MSQVFEREFESKIDCHCSEMVDVEVPVGEMVSHVEIGAQFHDDHMRYVEHITFEDIVIDGIGTVLMFKPAQPHQTVILVPEHNNRPSTGIVKVRFSLKLRPHDETITYQVKGTIHT